MPDFIQLEEELFAHDFKRTNFSCILFGCKIYLSIASLTNLCEDLEIAVAKSCAALSQIGSLSA